MPNWAPRPVPTSRAVGVARPSAHGQAMISTATAAVKAAVADAPISNQAASVSNDSPMTIGTKTAETRSARRCTSALPLWASVTSRAIWASWVSEPTRVARTSSRPPTLTVAPTTLSPGPTSTGTGSPVSIDASTADVPDDHDAVGGDLLAGPCHEDVADRELVYGYACFGRPVMRRTETSLAPMSSRARSAAPDRRLARASK